MEKNPRFIISSTGDLVNKRNIDDETMDLVLHQLYDHYGPNFVRLSTFSNPKGFMYNKFGDRELAWYFSSKEDQFYFDNFIVDTHSKLDILAVLDDVNYQSKMDYRRIIIRKYSHDLSNLLTIILINLGYMNDELESGRITTSDDNMIKEIVGSTFNTSKAIKDLIEKTREENEWKPEMVKGKSDFYEVFFLALELVRHQIGENVLLVANFPERREVMMEKAAMIRCLRIIYTNAINATQNLPNQVFELLIEHEDYYDVFTLFDNGVEFEQQKGNDPLTSTRQGKIGLGLTNLQKLISLVHGEVIIKSSNEKGVAIKIPRS